MTSIPLSAIAIILGIVFFILLAYKGLSPVLAALVAAVVVGLTCEGGLLNAIFTIFMGQAINFLGNILLLIVIGALLSAVLETTGVTTSLANGVVRLMGEKSVPLIVFILTLLLCYLGIGTYQFIVAPIALGLLRRANLPRRVGLVSMFVAFNAATYCLPGTPVTSNVLPATILGTGIFSGAAIGIVACILCGGLGLGYAYWLIKDARKQNQGFEETASAGVVGFGSGGPAKERTPENTPPLWNAVVTIILLFGLCVLFSQKWIGLDATQGVVLAQLLAGAWALITNFKRMNPGTRLVDLSRGTLAIVPLAIMLGFMSGFGAVVQNTAAFGALRDFLTSIQANPYLLTFVGVAVLSGCLGNGTGGIVMVLNALAPTLMASGANLGAIHRLTAMTASTLDSLPHSTYVCVSLQVFGLNHKDGYKYVFVSTVLIPIIYSFVCTILCMIFY